MNVPRLAQYRHYIAREWPRYVYFGTSLLVALSTLGSLVYATIFLWHTPYVGMSWDASAWIPVVRPPMQGFAQETKSSLSMEFHPPTFHPLDIRRYLVVQGNR